MISEVPFSAVEHLRKAARADAVNVGDKPNTRWFAAADNGEVVGIAALDHIGHERVVLHAVWVRPDWRGQGLGFDLVLRCIRECQLRGAAAIQANSHHPSFFTRLGFVAAAEPGRGGLTRVTLRLRASTAPRSASRSPARGNTRLLRRTGRTPSGA